MDLWDLFVWVDVIISLYLIYQPCCDYSGSALE